MPGPVLEQMRIDVRWFGMDVTRTEEVLNRYAWLCEELYVKRSEPSCPEL